MRLRLIAAIVVTIFVMALFGCTPKDIPVVPPPEPPPKEPTENGVTRVFSADGVSPGGIVNVKLYINLEPSQTYYLVDEGIPKEFSVTDKKPNKDNHIKLVTIQNAKSTVYEYTVKAPAEPGTYTWTGEYALQGMDAPADMMGQATINVK